MNILIVYASHDGQTGKIARFLAERLRAGRQHVEVMDAAQPRPRMSVEDYEAIVVGAPVRMQKYPLAIVNFVRANRARLAQVRSAFFSVCMAAASTDEARRRAAEAFPARLFADTGWQPALHATFAGAIRYTQYNWLVRMLMKRIARFEGASTDTSRDHEYTDWAAVERFADALPGLPPGRPARAP